MTDNYLTKRILNFGKDLSKRLKPFGTLSVFFFSPYELSFDFYLTQPLEDINNEFVTILRETLNKHYKNKSLKDVMEYNYNKKQNIIKFIFNIYV